MSWSSRSGQQTTSQSGVPPLAVNPRFDYLIMHRALPESETARRIWINPDMVAHISRHDGGGRVRVPLSATDARLLLATLQSIMRSARRHSAAPSDENSEYTSEIGWRGGVTTLHHTRVQDHGAIAVLTRFADELFVRADQTKPSRTKRRPA